MSVVTVILLLLCLTEIYVAVISRLKQHDLNKHDINKNEYNTYVLYVKDIRHSALYWRGEMGEG